MTPQKPFRQSRDGKKRKKTSSGGWTSWWPLLLGVAITPLALKTAEILPLMGPNGLMKLRLLYPYAMLIRERAFGFSEPVRESLSHLILYLQFPLYGLYASLAMRWKSWRAALLHILVFHSIAFGALWFLDHK